MIVQPIGRLMFIVSSESRKNKWYICDCEPTDDFSSKCDCPAWDYNVERPCKHIRAAIRYIRRVLERERAKEKPKSFRLKHQHKPRKRK